MFVKRRRSRGKRLGKERTKGEVLGAMGEARGNLRVVLETDASFIFLKLIKKINL